MKMNRNLYKKSEKILKNIKTYLKFVNTFFLSVKNNIDVLAF